LASAFLSSAWCGISTAAQPRITEVKPLDLYGSGIDFDVFRNGTKSGYHRVRFERFGDVVTAVTEFRLQIDILFFTAYRYSYRSEDRWQDGGLAHIKAEVNDDGNTFSLEATREGARMRIRGSDKSYMAEAPLFPTNHWNSAVLNQTQVLNTLTGEINAVRIEPREREYVPTERGPVAATRYAYTGELTTEVWYDDSGRWVKMRFKGKDGSNIEYVCRRCQGLAAGSQTQ
jgi:Family of unknown function (DUF6134)